MDESLRAIYLWSAQTRRSVAAWRREESRFLWPLLAFIIALYVGDQVGAVVVVTLAQSLSSSTPVLLSLLVVVNGVIPIGAGAALYLFFRSRNRRLDRPLERAAEPPGALPPNLIEASLVELGATDLALKSVHRRIWWIVFIACFLSLGVGEFSGYLIFQVYLHVTGLTVYPVLGSFLFTYGIGLAIAGVLIASNAIYWRRVERRLGELRTATDARRAGVTSLEQALWRRV